MKRFYLLSIILFMGAIYGFAQNVQLHYDFGHSLYDELNRRLLLQSVNRILVRCSQNLTSSYSAPKSSFSLSSNKSS